MKVKSDDPNEGGCEIDDPVQVKFFHNTKFCLRVQEYLQKLLSVQIAIVPQQLMKERWNTENVENGYQIHILDTKENKTEIEKVLSDAIKNLFETVQSQTFTNDKVKEWLQNRPNTLNNLACLQTIMDEKIHHLFTVCQEDPKYSLKIYYFSEDLSSVPNIKELIKIIPDKIVQETILFPYRSVHSRRVKHESEELIAGATAKGDISVSFTNDNSNLKMMQIKIIIFGYYKVVNQLKKDLLLMIARYDVTTFKFSSLDTYQVEFLLRNYRDELREIEEKYEQFGLVLRLRLNEFLAPAHLAKEIESSITQLLSDSNTRTFKSSSLSKGVAEIAEKHLKSIFQNNYCHIMTELRSKSQYYTIPKASSSNTEVMPVDGFLFSPNVFRKIVVANGSIEIRIGDIALQKVDTIVIPMTTNGLKEGVIERAGTFNYERTYTNATGPTFTETNGGKLSCKRILFSNWTPQTLINDENELRKSIQVFVSKSVEYTLKEGNA
ncbi:unnamed protein product, partial [Adineta steineri]